MQEFDDIPKESLISTLKEKLRENKQIQKKLDKLQEKYVATFKDQKLYQKDRETLIQSIGSILNEEPFKLEVKALGQFDLNVLLEQLNLREEDKSKALTNLIRETNNEKLQLEERFRQMAENSSQSQDQKTQQIIKQLKQQLNDLENNNTRLAKEIIELNDIIQIKNSQMQNLASLEEELTNLKTQQMLNELQSKQPDRMGRIQISDTLNEQLKMKQQIDKLLEEIQRLKKLVKHYESQQQQQQQQQLQQQQTKSIILNYEQNPFEDNENDNSQNQVNDTYSQNSNSKIPNNQQLGEIKMIEKAHVSIQTEQFEQIKIDEQDSNMEYLKNVIYKYFLYQETRNYKEAQILMNAIMTILRMSKEDKKRIQDAREKGFFKNAKNYITDNLFCMKQSQLNDMDLQHPQTKISQMNMHMN